MLINCRYRFNPIPVTADAPPRHVWQICFREPHRLRLLYHEHRGLVGVPPENAQSPFGLDPAAPGFWESGLRVIDGFIDELEG